jgi:hypothetical protein
MASRIFQDSKIMYLSIERASTLHPIWKDHNLDIPLNAIDPQGLIELMGYDSDDDWIEWLMMTHPIVLVEKQIKKSKAEVDGTEEQREAEYYRVMGHSTFNYLVSYIGAKYGSKYLQKKLYPMTIIPQKKLSRLETTILNTELAFSYLLQKSKQHRELMQEHLLSSLAPIPQINSNRQVSKFAQISHSSLSKSKASD